MRSEEFLNERKYLLNVSHKTLVYYRCAFNAWEKHKGDGKPATWIKNMLETGIKPVSNGWYPSRRNSASICFDIFTGTEPPNGSMYSGQKTTRKSPSAISNGTLRSSGKNLALAASASRRTRCATALR